MELVITLALVVFVLWAATRIGARIYGNDAYVGR